MKQILLAACAAALVAGCASGTKLDEVPVADRSAGTTTTTTVPGSAPAQSQVAPVVAGKSVDEAGGPTSIGRVVYFDYDSAQVKPEFQSVIDAHAQYLRRHRDRHLTIAGHTDERGGHEYNLALGQQRADSVRHSLHLLGVPDAQVETISFGEEKPAAPGESETAWSRNRRAEMGYQ